MRTVKCDGVPVFHAYGDGNILIDVPFLTPFGRLVKVYWQGRYEPLRYVGPFGDLLHHDRLLGRAIVLDGAASEHINIHHYTYMPILAELLAQWGPGQYSPGCYHLVRMPELCVAILHGPQPNMEKHLATFERVRQEATLNIAGQLKRARENKG